VDCAVLVVVSAAVSKAHARRRTMKWAWTMTVVVASGAQPAQKVPELLFVVDGQWHRAIPQLAERADQVHFVGVELAVVSRNLGAGGDQVALAER